MDALKALRYQATDNHRKWSKLKKNNKELISDTEKILAA